MVYANFKMLNDEYANKDRSDMSFDEQVSYVEDCYDTYEALGFNDTFTTQTEEMWDRIGERFTVIGRLSYVKGEADLEVLPMWHIKFEDGTLIDAFPEEICKAEK